MTAVDFLSTSPRRDRRRSSSNVGRVLAQVPTAVIALYVLAAVLGPILIDYDPVQTQLADRLLPPLSTRSTGDFMLLGTDATGRDIFAQMIYGARTSMLIGAVTVSVCGAVGLTLGLLAGYLRGLVDGVISRVIDVLAAFPGIVLAIVIAGLFQRGIVTVVVALGLSGWVSFARLTRGATLSLRERDWVAAARVIGVRPTRIMRRHVLPFLVGPVAALLTLEFGLIVLGEAGLSFLGIGLPSSSVSWGQTIANGKEYLATAWWISAFPGAALAVLVVTIGIRGDQLNSRYQRGASR